MQTIKDKVQIPDPQQEPIKYRIMCEYGAMWVSPGAQIILPSTFAFASSCDTRKYHEFIDTGVGWGAVKNLKTECKLQTPAAQDLDAAINEARAQNLSITARGNDSCQRSYKKTLDLWNSRVYPNLKHYVSTGQLSEAEANKVRLADTWSQVRLILQLEQEKGLLFDKYRQTSILNSVAAPGTSQHLSGLAFDLAQYNNPKARYILQQHGWWQTVEDDLPHFTYLGYRTEQQLREAGLKKIEKQGHIYWLPDLQ